MRNEIIIRDDISVFKQGLSVQLFSWRAERPDEWTMDEFADKSADMEKEIVDLKAERDELITQCSLDQEENINLKSELKTEINKAAELLENLDSAWSCIKYFKGEYFDDDLKEFMAKQEDAIKLMLEPKSEQAQRNDTPAKSAAEIGRDAIATSLKNTPTTYLTTQGLNEMHNITIQVCEKTSNIQALTAVLEFISVNVEGDHSYARNVTSDDEHKRAVVEAMPKNGEYTCEANFMVSVNETQP